MVAVENWSREGPANAMEWERVDNVRGMGPVSEEDLSEACGLHGRPRRGRSDEARTRHRDPKLREFADIPRRGSPAMREEIRARMARRERFRPPLPQRSR